MRCEVSRGRPPASDPRSAGLRSFCRFACIHRMPGRAIGAVFLPVPDPTTISWSGSSRPWPSISSSRAKAGAALGMFIAAQRKGFFRKDPFEVPRTGLHAPPTHRAAGGSDPVGGAFLAVGFPDLVAVEHQLWTRSDRARRAFRARIYYRTRKRIAGRSQSACHAPSACRWSLHRIFRRGPRKGLRITSPMRETSPRPDSNNKGGCRTSPSITVCALAL